MKKHQLRSLDPLLGFAYSMEDLPVSENEKRLPGFIVLDNEGIEAKKKLKIVILGGSTSSPYFEGNWPRYFKKFLDQSGIPSTIYNGAVNGYSTNQELLKFIRDGLPLKPDIVISLNGINDLGFIHSIRKHPMIHPYSNFVLRSVLKRGIRSKQKEDAVNSINFGPTVDTTPVEKWEENLRMLNTLAKEFGIEYHAFLQPTLGTGAYTSSDKEEEMLQEYINDMNPRYLEEIDKFYKVAREKSSVHHFMHDIVDVFKRHENIYYNARHPNEKGYQLIAKEIFRTIKTVI